ncbi:MAG: phosphatase PAP2 family protein [Phycisphaerales bacterium]
MFQIDIIIWLHSLRSPALTWCLSTVSFLGYTPVYAALILVFAFGIRLRPSLAVFLGLLLAGILTNTLKTGLALPRPSDIHARAGEPGDGIPPIAVVEQGAAPSFWALPTSEAIAAARGRPETSYGFPSGHVSSAAVFFLGVALFFRSRYSLLFAIFWIPLMGISRMYLGRHFLADVLGGVTVGVVGVLAAALLLRPFVVHQPHRPTRRAALVPLVVVSLLLLLVTPFVSILDAENVGRLVGLVIAYVVLAATDLPFDNGSIWQRLGRVLIAFAIGIAMSQSTGAFFAAAGWEDTRLGALAAAALVTAATLAGTVAVSPRLRLCVAA